MGVVEASLTQRQLLFFPGQFCREGGTREVDSPAAGVRILLAGEGGQVGQGSVCTVMCVFCAKVAGTSLFLATI